MKAEEVAAKRLFAPGVQLKIPIWQRRYSWDQQDWFELWKDLQRLRDGSSSSHFLGSFVLKALPWTGLPSEAQRYWVVDGQQRMTTLTVLAAVLRDQIADAADNEDDAEAARQAFTKQLLRNADLQPDHRHRLVLQHPDDAALQALIDGEPVGADAAVAKAYAFFADEAKGLPTEEKERLLGLVLTSVDGVWVILEESDNAHRVFQTLNAGGKPLRQADLVRNYFFLLLGDAGDAFYTSHWRSLEDSFDARELEDYFVAWTISQGHAGSKQSLFRYFQSDLRASEEDADAVKSYGTQLAAAATLFERIRGKSAFGNVDVERVMEDLRNWGTTPAEGLILHVLRRQEAGSLSESNVTDALECILSFMARRFLGGYEPNLHKSIFVRAAHRLRQASDLEGDAAISYLRYVLSQGEDVRTWPSDELLIERAATTPLYTDSRSRWVFSVLERINRAAYEDAKQAPKRLPRVDFSVEHVMPQTLNEAWEDDLISWGIESPSRFHQARLHVLGNLSLSPINSALSNKKFSQKRSLIQHDYLRINLSMKDEAAWEGHRIDARSKALVALACEAFVPPLSEEQRNSATFDRLVGDEVPDPLEDESEDG